jgi:hypothetical protein
MALNATTLYSAAPLLLAVSTTLTAAQSGRYVSTTNAITITLPTNPPVGTNYKIISLSTGLVTIACGGTNTFSQNNNSTTTLRLVASGFQSVELFYNGGIWYIVGGLYDCLRASKNVFFAAGLTAGTTSSGIHVVFGVSPTTITATSTLAFPLYGTHLVSSSANATITLPTITGTMIGHTVGFRKTGTLASVISVSAGGTNTIYIRDNITTVAAGVPTQIMSGTQAYGEIRCISSSAWAII